MLSNMRILGCAAILWGLMLLPVLHGNEIRWEAEDFSGAKRLVPGDDYSGKGTAGKWYRLSRRPKITEPGLYYVWVRFSGDWKYYEPSSGEEAARKLRYFALELGDQRLVFDDDVPAGLCWSVRRVVLPAGNLYVALDRIGVDPYVDVVILTKDYNYLPEPRHHTKSGKKVPDFIAGRAVYPPASTTLAVPHNQTGTNAIFSIKDNSASGTDNQTTLTASHDGTNLKLLFNCMQPQASLQCNSSDPGAGDCIEIVLDGNHSMGNLRHIVVNPAGERAFAKVTGIYRNLDWQPGWLMQNAVQAESWSVEITIPMVELFDTLPGSVGEIRANFQRKTQGNKVLARWSESDQPFMNPDGFGVLEISDKPEAEWYAAWGAMLHKRAALCVVDRAGTGSQLDIPWEFERSYGNERLRNTISDKYDLVELWEFEQKINSVEQAHYQPPGGVAMAFEGVNLMPNPGFEYGRVMNGYVLPLNWRCGAGGVATLVPGTLQGQQAMRIEVLQEQCVVRPGVRPYLDSTIEYEWRGWFKGRVPEGGKAALKVNWLVQDLDKPGGWGAVKPGGESRIEFVPGNEWQEVVLSAKPVTGTMRCTFELEVAGTGGVLLCDNFSFDGMGVDNVDFFLPQPGFDSRADKQVVIWSRHEPEPKFKLLSNDKLILNDKLNVYGVSRWKGTTYFADLSRVKTPGKYTLAISVQGREYLSPEFVIEDNLYLKYAKFASQFYFIQRQGVDVPGWHKANFLDDALLVDTATGKIVGHRDLSGGWQDAGDPSKQACSDLSIYGLAEFFENTGLLEYELKEKYPDLLSLAWAEVDRQINKCYVGEGLFYRPSVNNVSHASWSGKAKEAGYYTRSIFKLDPSEWSDNKPNTWDDRYTPATPELQKLASGLSKFAIAVKKFDPAVSKQIAGIMAEDFAARQKQQATWETKPLVRIAMGDGELCRTATHLAYLGEDAKYRQAAEQYATEIIRAFDLKLYLYDPFHELTSGDLRCSYYNLAIALFDYARYLPDNPHMSDIRRVIQDFIEDGIIRRAADNEFGIVTHYTPGPGLRVANPKRFSARYPQTRAGYNQQLASLGYLAARAAGFCNKPEYLAYADRAAQWVVGRNPKGISMLIGNGWKFAATSTTLRNCKGHEDGVVPGVVIRGMSTKPDSPPEFPTLNVSSNPGGNAASDMHEVYQRDTIAFINVCQELYATRKRMEENK